MVQSEMSQKNGQEQATPDKYKQRITQELLRIIQLFCEGHNIEL